ncbi:hypothetical protein [Niastella sp. OAS944]|uniref:hypothetical protein n=1 Tax=Niastella sp. OAS944 TaxID=2664089 RepID=UPI00349699AD|nr:hypothetical protein [Chitinophagaceae bacterium OAS944]
MEHHTDNRGINRIDAALAQWDQQNDKYIQRYGRDVLQDRDYQKVRRDVLMQVYNDNKNKKNLTTAEKMDLRVLKGQLNQMDRQLYSRPVRAIRNMYAVLKSIVNALTKSISSPVKSIQPAASRRPAANNNALSQPREPALAHSATMTIAGHGQQQLTNGSNHMANGTQNNGQQSTVTKSAAPAKVIQRNFRNNVRKVLQAEKGKGIKK